jgi:hypothetical protein
LSARMAAKRSRFPPVGPTRVADAAPAMAVRLALPRRVVVATGEAGRRAAQSGESGKATLAA